MALPVAPPSAARRRILPVLLTQGTLGVSAMLLLTWLRREQTAAILDTLGGGAPILIAIFILFASTLAMLKFEITSLVYISLAVTAYMAFFPLLGAVLTSWLAVGVAMFTRILAMHEIGPVKIEMDDPLTEWARVYGLFATYGIPVVAAAALYDAIGGAIPVMQPTVANAMKIAVCGVAMMITNTLMMLRIYHAYGYEWRKVARIEGIDKAIYLLTLPYAVLTALSYGAMGWGAVAALGFTGIVANIIGRNLAVARAQSRQQLQRLASLTNIGKTISLRFTTEQLLTAIYTECKKVIDCSLFALALYEESTNELSFELDVRDGTILAKERMQVGEGLNSWVIANAQPLLLGSIADERRFGIRSIPDTKPTESWLGVPMIARDRVLGVISVESYRKHAFTQEDLILMTAIANQAAVAIENQQLYKDLEGLTVALEQRVHDRTNELREANLRLMAADRSKNQFLANMSHELRTPLNSIIGFSSVLLENTRNAIAPRLHKFLENIHTAGNHLLALINDILDLSKIEAGKMELRADTFDLRETIAAVERVMKGFAAEARVRLHSTIAADVPQVRLDEGRLKQILFNLLSNAVKFSPADGVVSIDIRALAADASPIGIDTIRIDVTDQGIGIPADELQRIFHEFYQTEVGRRARRGGTGLGLSLTRNFVELHYGTIEVQSTPGSGSTFTLYLPVDYDEAARRPAALPSGAISSAAQIRIKGIH